MYVGAEAPEDEGEAGMFALPVYETCQFELQAKGYHMHKSLLRRTADSDARSRH